MILFDVMDIMKYGMIGLDILFIVVAILTLITGIKRGFLRYLLTSGVFWAMVIVFIIFFSEMLTSLLLKIQIKGITIEEILVNFLTSQLNIDSNSLSDTYTLSLIKGTVISFGRSLVVSIGFSLIWVIIYPIYKLILSVTGLNASLKANKKSGISRLLGALLAIIVIGFKAVIVFGPIYGSLTLASDIAGDVINIAPLVENIKGDDTNNQMDEILTYTKDSKNYIDKSLVVKAYRLTGDYNIAAKYMAYISSSKEYANVNFIQEYYLARPLIKTINNIDLNSEDFYKNFTASDIKNIFNYLKESQIKTIIPVIVEMVALTDNPYQEYINIDEVKSIDWNAELASFNPVLTTLEDMSTHYYQATKIEDILDSEYLDSDIYNLLNSIFSINIVKTKLVSVAQNYINNYQNEDEDLNNLLHNINITDVINNDLDNLSLVISHGARIGYEYYKDQHFSVNLLLQNKDSLNIIINNIFQMNVCKNNAGAITTLLVKKIAPDFDITTTQIDNIVWDFEGTNLVNITSEVINLFGSEELTPEAILEIFKTKDTTALIDALCESELFNKVFIYILDDKLADILNKDSDTELVINKLSSLTNEQLKSDLHKIIEMYITISSYDSLDMAINEKGEELIKELFKLNIVIGHEKDVFNYAIDKLAIKDNFNELPLEFNLDNVTDWDAEISNIFVVIDKIKSINFEDGINSDNKETYKEIMHQILNIQMINESLPKLVDYFFSGTPLKDWESDWLLNQIDHFTLSVWENEIDTLIDGLSSLSDVSENIGENIANLSDYKDTLIILSHAKSIKFDAIKDLIDENLKALTNTDNIYTTLNGVNWEEEINLFLDSDSIILQVLTSDNNSFSDYGKTIDQLKTSNLIGANINNLIRDLIKNTDAYNIIFTDNDLTDENLNMVESWESELAVLDDINLDALTQNGAILDDIAHTKIIKNKIADYMYQYIEDKQLTSYYSKEELFSDIAVVNEKVVNENYSWQIEIDTIAEFEAQLDKTKAEGIAKLFENKQQLEIIANRAIITSTMISNVTYNF